MSLLLPEPSPESDTPDPAPQEEFVPEEEAVDDAQTDETASEDEAPEEEDPEEPPLFTVKVDGQERRVTLEELTRSYSGTASIQRRIQDAEASRKEAEGIFAALQNEYAQVQAFAQRLQTQGLKPAPTPPPADLAQKNPAAYVQALAKFNEEAAAWKRQQGEIQAIEERQARITQAAMQAHLAEQYRHLAENIPAFAQPETAAKERDRLVRVAREIGYSEEEVGGITDWRAVKALQIVADHMDLMARKAEVAKKLPTQAPRHVPPAAKPRAEPPQLVRAKKLAHARKSNDVDAWAALLLNPES